MSMLTFGLEWIYNNGHTAEIYENIHASPEWTHGDKSLFSVPGLREGIHLVDWDGDGRCDMLVQDKATGALQMWKNEYNNGTKRVSLPVEIHTLGLLRVPM
jgi:hypothetical protein